MYTVDDANQDDQADLDRRIREAVMKQDGGYKAAYLRIYIEDPWFYQIESELERRGFRVLHKPDIILKGDVLFTWREEEEDD